MGFLALGQKVFMTRCSLLGLMHYIPTAQRSLPLSSSRIRFGRYGKVVLSNRPEPEAMSSIVAAHAETGATIRLSRDEVFFRWRFESPRSKNVFYYAMEGDRLTGYLVMGISPNNRRGYILDYAEEGAAAVEDILESVIEARYFDLLSIYDFCLDNTFRQRLKGKGFKTHSLVRIIERKLHGELPLLIRPVKETFEENDFFIEGIDSRKLENWSLKPICSDAA
jgi:hypothetical protein